MQEAARRVQATIKHLEEQELKGLSKTRRDEALAELHQLERDLRDRLPFVAKQFAEHMEDVVEKAKIEVNAYVQSTIQRAGLAAIAAGEAPPLQLGTGVPDADERDSGS
jgi:hypothetical protein